jgi:2-oxoglutarate ferredoxin oxidoreductase, beta subunit (EC 1.2.7.3)
MANPDLTIVNVMGDGDGTAIGGNHFIHACRRNIGITAVVMNNNIYGMTGGQASPTTRKAHSPQQLPTVQSTPHSTSANSQKGAGATYVARAQSLSRNVRADTQKGDQHQKKGFAVVELVSFCHTQFGRKNKRSRPMDNINYLKDNSVMKAKADTMTAEELKGKIIIGEFVNVEDAREYTERYDEIIARAQKA